VRYPHEVRALVLCSSCARLEILDPVLDLHRRVTEGRERRPFSRELFSSAASPEILRQGFMEDMKTDPRARFGDMLAARDWNPEERLDALAVPGLVVWGEDEQPALAAQAKLLSARWRSAQQLIVPKAGHMLPLEAPEALAEGVERFLADLDR
jgi:pimeloyl-ACP methyl ester carboxylesterase